MRRANSFDNSDATEASQQVVRYPGDLLETVQTAVISHLGVDPAEIRHVSPSKLPPNQLEFHVHHYHHILLDGPQKGQSASARPSNYSVLPLAKTRKDYDEMANKALLDILWNKNQPFYKTGVPARRPVIEAAYPVNNNKPATIMPSPEQQPLSNTGTKLRSLEEAAQDGIQKLSDLGTLIDADLKKGVRYLKRRKEMASPPRHREESFEEESQVAQETFKAAAHKTQASKERLRSLVTECAHANVRSIEEQRVRSIEDERRRKELEALQKIESCIREQEEAKHQPSSPLSDESDASATLAYQLQEQQKHRLEQQRILEQQIAEKKRREQELVEHQTREYQRQQEQIMEQRRKEQQRQEQRRLEQQKIEHQKIKKILLDHLLRQQSKRQSLQNEFQKQQDLPKLQPKQQTSDRPQSPQHQQAAYHVSERPDSPRFQQHSPTHHRPDSPKPTHYVSDRPESPRFEHHKPTPYVSERPGSPRFEQQTHYVSGRPDSPRFEQQIPYVSRPDSPKQERLKPTHHVSERPDSPKHGRFEQPKPTQHFSERPESPRHERFEHHEPVRHRVEPEVQKHERIQQRVLVEEPESPQAQVVEYQEPEEAHMGTCGGFYARVKNVRLEQLKPILQVRDKEKPKPEPRPRTPVSPSCLPQALETRPRTPRTPQAGISSTNEYMRLFHEQPQVDFDAEVSKLISGLALDNIRDALSNLEQKLTNVENLRCQVAMRIRDIGGGQEQGHREERGIMTEDGMKDQLEDEVATLKEVNQRLQGELEQIWENKQHTETNAMNEADYERLKQANQTLQLQLENLQGKGMKDLSNQDLLQNLRNLLEDADVIQNSLKATKQSISREDGQHSGRSKHPREHTLLARELNSDLMANLSRMEAALNEFSAVTRNLLPYFEEHVVITRNLTKSTQPVACLSDAEQDAHLEAFKRAAKLKRRQINEIPFFAEHEDRQEDEIFDNNKRDMDSLEHHYDIHRSPKSGDMTMRRHHLPKSPKSPKSPKAPKKLPDSEQMMTQMNRLDRMKREVEDKLGILEDEICKSSLEIQDLETHNVVMKDLVVEAEEMKRETGSIRRRMIRLQDALVVKGSSLF